MTTPTGRFYIEPVPPMQGPTRAFYREDEFERLLRESYQPILSEEDYEKIREKCGLGKLIEGEVIENGKAKG